MDPVDFSWSPNAAAVRLPVSSVLVKAHEYYKTLSGLRHLEDFDVIFYIIHKWSPDKRQNFDNVVRTKAWTLGAELQQNNHVFDYKYVEDNSFLSREPADVSSLMDILRAEMKRYDSIPIDTPLNINGIEYTAIGRDGQSAKLLHSILSLSVSEDQINHLRQDILNNGLISRIILDDDMENKIKKLSDVPFFSKVAKFADFFKTYFADTILRYAASLLLFEHEITADQLLHFVDKNNADIHTLVTSEIQIESALPVVSKKSNTTDIYVNDQGYTDPWVSLPDFDAVIRPIMDTRVDFEAKVDALTVDFAYLTTGMFTEKTELLGSTIYHAGTEITHNYSYRAVEELAKEYRIQSKNKLNVFVVGPNRATPYQNLGISAARTHVYRAAGDGYFDNVTLDKTDSVIYPTPELFGVNIVDNAHCSAVCVDTVTYSDTVTRTSAYRLPQLRGRVGSLSHALRLVRNLLSKPKGIEPEAYHGRLPLMICMRFVPNFIDDAPINKGILNALSHHYEIRFAPPTDFYGLEFHAVLTKRPTMLPKQLDIRRSVFSVLCAFVCHALVVRRLLLGGILVHKFNWKVLQPIRAVSRMYGIGSKIKFKVQDLLDFTDWGVTHSINDFNNVFTDYVGADRYNKEIRLVTRNSAGVKKKARKNFDKGKSVLVLNNANALKMFGNFKGEYFGAKASDANLAVNVNSPLFKREKVIASSATY